ncbi:MAG: prepilin-type N-terminal cleavage/methylation domain-containing protein [Candidatus Nomurabacteria bacterium]|nr:prepilin-type N-terminal cleavage/methylation domain-containing protein [Candidatus Nomurabacteria bacterium]
MQKIINKKESGFTIIEVMISVALFTTIIIVGIGALINAGNLHNKSSKVRSILDNLSFVMEDMSRNLRTGDTYLCTSDVEAGPDCSDGKQIIFNNNTAGVAGEKWLYAFTDSSMYTGSVNIIKATSTDLQTFPVMSVDNIIQLNPDEIRLDSSSGFTVVGANTDDTFQPYVIIRLSGKIIYKNNEIPFKLETSVSQRFNDIVSPPPPVAGALGAGPVVPAVTIP